MKTPLKAALFSAALALTPAAAAAADSMDAVPLQSFQKLNDRMADLKRMQAVIARWPQNSQDLANLIMSEYGTPDMIAPSELTWNDRGIWKQIDVFRDVADPARPDNLLESVAYEAPLRSWRALGNFDRGVDYDPITNELVARSDRESTNYLALNLADEIVRGVRTPLEATGFFDKTIDQSLAGKSSRYTRKLLFAPGTRATARRRRFIPDDGNYDQLR